MTDAIVTYSEYFAELALNELQRSHPKIKPVKPLSPQHLYVSNPGSFGALTRPWKNKLPIYLHHLFPVQRQISLKGTLSDLYNLRDVANELSGQDIAVQVRIVDNYRYAPLSVSHVIQNNQDISSSSPERQVLSVLIAGNTAYMGISRASWNLSPFAGGAQFFDEPVPNRAGLKLLESLSTFDIRLNPGTTALDLGAAPGAWTELLRRRDVAVTAVSPDEMYDWLKVDSHVKVFRMTAEEYLERCQTCFDLLVNDMKLDAQDSAKLMVDYARHLKQGGIAIMTLKLRMRNTRRVMDHSFRILRKAYKIIYVRQLVNNRKEVTLFLRKHD